jgi:choline dehydrogenase-like flavoprotein
MLIDTRDLKSPELFECDICIVGAGVVGSVIVAELINSGLSLLILESGGEYYDHTVQELYEAESIPAGFDNPLYSRLRMLGGSSNHWENSMERFDPIDFEKREWVGNSGWPITYDDIEPYYAKAGLYCKVGAEDFDSDTWQKIQPFTDILSESEDIETSFTKAPLRPTRFYQAHLEPISQRHNLKLITNATLTDIEFDPENQIVISSTFASNAEYSHKVKATTFIFCMGGLENTRMLLTFNEKYQHQLGNKSGALGHYFMEHPTIRGLHFYPFSNKRVPSIYTEGFQKEGIHLSARLKFNDTTLKKHGINNLRFSMAPKTNLNLSHGVASSNIIKDSISDGEVPENFGSHLVSVLGDLDMVADAFSRKMFEYSLSEESDEFGGYQIIGMIDQSPEWGNKVMLGSERDRFGTKRIKVEWKVSQNDRESAWRSLETLAKDETLNRIGRFRLLKERESRIWNSQLGFGHHHTGTTKMGVSEKNAVTDSDCKVFGTKNLYIGGSSVFPTGGHVPPTLTIVALSIRLARLLHKGKIS